VTGGLWQASLVNPVSGNGAANARFTGAGVSGGVGSKFFPAGQQWYTASDGTSHSTPAVAGGAALIRQDFINNGLTPPSPALTKAALMATARYMNGVSANDTLWSNSQGMGEMNLDTFFDVFNTTSLIKDESAGNTFTASGQSRVFTGNITSSAKPLRVTLAWTDAPGPTSGASYLNNLDLEVTVGGQTYKGNVFSGANSVTGGSADFRNNAESVFLPAGVSGPIAIKVKATSIVADGVPNFGGALDQDFALMAYNVTEVAQPVIATAGANITVEGCSPPDGAIDPGETVTVSFSLQNVGTLNNTNLVATLQATGGVILPTGPVTYGVVTAGGAAVSGSFSFAASASVPLGSTLTATLQLQDGANNLGTVAFTFTAGVQVVVLSENFDGVVAPALPAGWTTALIVGTPGTDAVWTTTSSTSNTSPNSATTNDPGHVTDKVLISPSVAITTASAQLTFQNNYDLESGSGTTAFDAGVLEIKIGAGAFTDILSAGGSFVTGGYNHTVSSSFSNPLAGRQAWSGNSNGFVSTVVNLPASAAGQTIQLRWRVASDTSVGITGQFIDTVQITDGYMGCNDTTAPRVSGVSVGGTGWAGADYSVPGGGTQLRPLPWINVTRVTIAFNENVLVDQNDLVINGVNVGTYGTTGFSYNPATYRATWSLASPIGSDKLTLTLDGNTATAVTDVTGNKLDGEWTNNSSTFPSGNGTAGGNFVFGVWVLPGDVDGSGLVNVNDVAIARTKFLASAPDLYADVDHSGGAVTLTDYNNVRTRQGNVLP
jgi:hypothetical protein